MSSTATAVPFGIAGNAAANPAAVAPSRRYMLVVGTIAAFIGAGSLVPTAAVSSTSVPSIAISENALQEEAYTPSLAVEQSIARLREFGSYQDDWDDRGAKAADPAAVNSALEYLTTLEPWHPDPFATISRDGEAILEFQDDTGRISTIRFLNGADVELYCKTEGMPSEFIEGKIGTERVTTFLSQTMNLPIL